MPSPLHDLTGLSLVVTRPVGQATALCRQIRARGGQPLRLPGLSLRPVAQPQLVRPQLAQALADDELLIFTSPAAVAHAARLVPLRSRAQVLAVGQATVLALRRHGLRQASAPARQDSEGLLAEPALQQLAGRRVALIGAAGGRELLPRQLLERGAQLRQLAVYRRQPARLGAAHARRLLAADGRLVTLLSSAQTLQHLQQGLPAAAWQRLQRGWLLVSSQRLEQAARAVGFTQVRQVGSPLGSALLAAAAALPV